MDLKDFEVFTLDPGENVFCDWCSKDWTNSDVSGGFLFQSKATCPDCAPPMMKKIRSYNEKHFIRGYCPKNMSFADWIRSKR